MMPGWVMARAGRGRSEGRTGQCQARQARRNGGGELRDARSCGEQSAFFPGSSVNEGRIFFYTSFYTEPMTLRRTKASDRVNESRSTPAPPAPSVAGQFRCRRPACLSRAAQEPGQQFKLLT